MIPFFSENNKLVFAVMSKAFLKKWDYQVMRQTNGAFSSTAPSAV
jgi:hypothetical protein